MSTDPFQGWALIGRYPDHYSTNLHGYRLDVQRICGEWGYGIMWEGVLMDAHAHQDWSPDEARARCLEALGRLTRPAPDPSFADDLRAEVYDPPWGIRDGAHAAVDDIDEETA